MTPYPPVFVTVDVVLLTIRDAALQVLMVRRGSAPFKGWPALPGGFVRQREDLATAARRELHEGTGLRVQPKHLEQLATFGSPTRDRRARTVSVAYLGVLPSLPDPTAGTDAVSAAWHPVAEMLGRRLPFDHSPILELGVERARSKLEYTPLAAAFCEDSFTVAELRQVYEIVWGRAVDPGNFHRKVTGALGFVVATDDTRSGSRGRPAAVYRSGPSETLNPPILR
jgi:8-oxo-dGTP diphosphatase